MRQGQGKLRGHRPALWLMTDERIGEADLLRAVMRLPRGAAIILRHYGFPEQARRALFETLRRLARRRGLVLLLAGTATQARAWGADGHHGRTRDGRTRAPHGKRWLHSAPAHDHREMVAATRAGADVLFLSPLFVTRSHPGAAPLGPARFAALARRSPIPVMALGGVKRRHERLVRRLGASGLAAIDGLVPRRPR